MRLGAFRKRPLLHGIRHVKAECGSAAARGEMFTFVAFL
jgi:hypothetical protein